jgi:hypothetical protein
MKYIKIIFLVCGFVIIAIPFISCNRDIPHIAQTQTVGISSATVQVFNATVSAKRNYVYVDNVPVSGALLAYSGIFPGTAYGFNVTPSSHTFLIKDTLSATTQTPVSLTAIISAGKSYTVFTYDTITSTKALVVLNNITVPSDTTCRLRFGNFIYNTSAIPNVDVYSYRKGGVGGLSATSVFSNVATDSVTSYIPYASGLTDTLYIYSTGTTTPLLAKFLLTSLTPTRSYTAAYSGSYKSTTKTLSTFANY